MTAAPTDSAAPVRARRPLVRRSLQLICTMVCLGLLALGTWQVQRRQWKLDLIERTTQRVHATPIAIPAPAEWPQITAATHEYRHLLLSGRWRNPTCIVRSQALTELGSGFWQLQPLESSDGSIVWVNQGFIPDSHSASPADAAAAGATAVATATAPEIIERAGLLRISEPRGSFLRKNEPQAGHWYARDVAAMTAQCGLPAARTAPFFVDLDATEAQDTRYPVPGLTVIEFHNNHAVYALTWYILALMVAWAAWRIGRPDATQDTDPEPDTPT